MEEDKFALLFGFYIGEPVREIHTETEGRVVGGKVIENSSLFINMEFVVDGNILTKYFSPSRLVSDVESYTLRDSIAQNG